MNLGELSSCVSGHIWAKDASEKWPGARSWVREGGLSDILLGIGAEGGCHLQGSLGTVAGQEGGSSISPAFLSASSTCPEGMELGLWLQVNTLSLHDFS